MDQKKIDRCVETLSLRGCAAVLTVIRLLEADSPLPDTAELSADERRAVLDELKSVMAIYGERKGGT